MEIYGELAVQRLAVWQRQLLKARSKGQIQSVAVKKGKAAAKTG